MRKSLKPVSNALDLEPSDSRSHVRLDLGQKGNASVHPLLQQLVSIDPLFTEVPNRLWLEQWQIGNLLVLELSVAHGPLAHLQPKQPKQKIKCSSLKPKKEKKNKNQVFQVSCLHLICPFSFALRFAFGTVLLEHFIFYDFCAVYS
jgi:hypothetical protein